MMMDIDDLATLLQAACRPAALRAPAARALAALGRPHQLDGGAHLFDPGAHIDALWLVARGCIAVGHVDAAGHWRPVRTVQSGEWLDAASAWLDLPLAEQAVAEADSTLVAFAAAEVEGLCAPHPSIARVLITLLARRVRQLTENAHGLRSKDVLARVAQAGSSTRCAGAAPLVDGLIGVKPRRRPPP